MSRLIFLGFFLWIHSLNAQTTTYRWEPNTKNQLDGECFQVDSDTSGKKFRIKVKKELCKTEKIELIFYPSKGRCYEVDSETEGRKYIKQTKTEACRPNKVFIGFFNINNVPACYEVDSETKGKKYFYKKKPKECETQEASMTYWEYIDRGKGKCYEGRNTGADEVKLRVKNEKCRTANTHFYFVRLKETVGECIEEDKENPKAYSNKTKTENCKPEKTIFIFYTPPNSKLGKCYEVDSDSKGDQYINVVEPKNCISN